MEENRGFSSYDVLDTEPPSFKFKPPLPPGLHLTDRTTKTGVRRFTKAIDFFELFMPDEILEMIVDNTDIYAYLNIFDKPTYADKHGAWRRTSVQELKHLIAILLYNGFAGRRDIERNWSQATLYSGGRARRFVSKNRFKALCAMLHISKPGMEDPTVKLAKVRPLIEHMRKMCRKYFQPYQGISIDERMVGSKGRSPIKQYMPSKPTQYGFKLWCICDPETGYTIDFSVYTGRDESRTDNGLGFDVVASLMKPYYNHGYSVFCDNFFTSVNLAKHLILNGTHLCGTIRPWRKGFPQSLRDKKWMKHAKPGDMRYVRDEGVIMMQWCDKRIVNMMSTMHKGNDHIFVIRCGKDKQGKYKHDMVRIPTCVKAYNKCMGGVDHADQMLESYSCSMKVVRWWKTLFFHMLDMAVLNSYILFTLWQKEHPHIPGLQRRRGYVHLDFREELVRQLARIREDEMPPIYEPAVRRVKSLNLTGPHDPQYTRYRQNCQVCYILHKKQRKSYIRCADPQCQVHLCLSKKRNCFPKWHSRDFDPYRFGTKEE